MNVTAGPLNSTSSLLRSLSYIRLDESEFGRVVRVVWETPVGKNGARNCTVRSIVTVAWQLWRSCNARMLASQLCFTHTYHIPTTLFPPYVCR